MSRRLPPALALAFALLALTPAAVAQGVTPPPADSAAVVIAPPTAAVGVGLPLTLGAAVDRALGQSEEVGLAQAQVRLADAQVREAYASLYPQINGSANYTRTLASSVGGGGFEIPDSLQFDPDPTLPLEDRVEYLEQNTSNAALGALAGLFSNLPFGQVNAYQFGLTGSQLLFSGAVGPGLRIARSARQAADLQLVEATADLRLQVEQAYIQALVAQELVSISRAALAQAQAFLDDRRLYFNAGRASELEVLRAEVDLENLRPALVQAESAADLAVLNLKRLTNIPYEQPVTLTTPLTLPPASALVDADLDPAVTLEQRASVQAAEAAVEIYAQQVRVQRAAYLPSLTLQSSYGRVLYPSSIFAFDTPLRTDWTVTVAMQVPIFDGFRRRAQVEQARVALSTAEFQLAQLREAVQLQVEQALRDKRRAAALITARQRTVEQAARVYRLTELQYREGLATHLEVSTSRLSLLQARSNLVQALADFYTADTGLSRALASPGVTSTTFAMPVGEAIPQPDVLAPLPEVIVPDAGDLTPAPVPTPAPAPTPAPTDGTPTDGQ